MVLSGVLQLPALSRSVTYVTQLKTLFQCVVKSAEMASKLALKRVMMATLLTMMAVRSSARKNQDSHSLLETRQSPQKFVVTVRKEVFSHAMMAMLSVATAAQLAAH